MLILSLAIINYKMYEWFLVLLLLIPQAIFDIKNQSVYVWPNVVALFLIQTFCVEGGVAAHLIRLIPGILFIVFTFASKEAIGTGDGIVILALGTILGIENTFKAIFYATVLASVFSLVLICLRKVNKKTRLPFVPFLLLGTVIGGII